MNRAQEILLGDDIVVCDGAMGTMLHSLGASLSQSFDELNISRPDLVSSVHREYVDAGATIIETNTFGANPLKLQGYGLSGRAAEINAAGARLARECARSRAPVAGSVGPTGKLLQPLGPLTFDELHSAFREQIAALCEGGVDLLIIETMQDLREMKAALLAARCVADIPVVVQVSFSQEGRTMMGTDPATAAVVLSGLRPTLIGTNCGTGPQDMLDAVRAMSVVTSTGVTAQPNAGLPRFYEGRLLYLSTPEYMAGFGRQFVEAGAVLVGGCCGTTPEHIRALAAAVGGMKRERRAGSDGVRLASRSRIVALGVGKPVLFGRRSASDMTFAAQVESIEAQIRAGARVVYIACESDDSAGKLIEAAQTTGDAALCLSGTDAGVIERSLRLVEGRAAVLCGSNPELVPIAARYGCVVIADADGNSPEEQLACARQILRSAHEHGLSKTDIVIRTDSTSTEDVLRAVKLIRSDLGLSTLVEHGPDSIRGDAAASVLKALVEAGVDAIAVDATAPEIQALGLGEEE